MRKPLLRELLRLEMELRRNRGETVAVNDYQERFPGYPDVFRALSEERAADLESAEAGEVIEGDAEFSFMVTTPGGRVRPPLGSKELAELRKSFRPGQVLQDNYRLVRVLGFGGMGLVDAVGRVRDYRFQERQRSRFRL